MKKIKHIFIIMILTIVFYLISVQILINKSNTVNAQDADIYDVILFWGQSNMVGTCGLRDTEKEKDTRYNYKDNESVSQFSKITGISEEILRNSKTMNHINITQESETAFEYLYMSNTLQEITENTKILGESLKYNKATKKLEEVTSGYSIQKSYGTNMIPQFCKTYYEHTGHKVVAVFCANGGEIIENFLPSTDEDYGDKNTQYIYEAMVEKYNSATKYLEDNNYKIGNKLYVVFQGETNAYNGRTSTEDYKKYFKKVHKYLKNDTGITKGAIVQTAREIGLANHYKGTMQIHQAQEELINENNDIILGTSYAWDHYVPDETNYKSEEFKTNIFIDSEGNKLEYNKAYEYAGYSVCPDNNIIHFTSAALSQIGAETAEEFSKIVDMKIIKKPEKLEYIQNYDELNLQGGKVQLTYNNGTEEIISMDNSKITVKGFNNKDLGENKITLSIGQLSASFNINIIPKSIVTIEISSKPTQLQYIQNYDELNLDGGKILVKYNNETSQEVDMSNSQIEISGFNNSVLGSQIITVRYGGKVTEFNVEIIGKSVQSIEVLKEPTQLQYIQNYEELNLDGGKISVKYNDETLQEVDMSNSQIEVSGFNNLVLGTQTIIVHYGEKTTKFNVEIIKKSILSIEILEKPTQLQYIQNYDNLNLDGGKILVKYNDETSQEVDMSNSQIEVTGFDNTVLGIQNVTISYAGKITQFDIEVIKVNDKQPSEEQSNDNVDQSIVGNNSTMVQGSLPNAGKINKIIIIALIILGIFMVAFLKYKIDKMKKI